MKKLTKNLLMTFGLVASVTTPLVSVISCGNSSKVNPNNTDTEKKFNWW